MKLKYHLFCLITICLFSTLELAGKKLGTDISPFTITAWRFLIGGIVILPFAIRQVRINKIVIQRNNIIFMGLLGILNVCISMLILQVAIFYGKASLVAILVSINPLFVSIFAMLILKEKLALGQLIGLIAGALGLIAIVLGERGLYGGEHRNLMLGIILALIAAMTFGLYTVLTKKTVISCGNLLTNSISFIIGALTLFLITAILGKPLLIGLEPKNLLITAYLGLFITGIAYLLYFEGMKGLTAAKASQYFFLKPVLASIMAYFFLQETLSPLQIFGMTLVIISLAWKLIAKGISLIFPAN